MTGWMLDQAVEWILGSVRDTLNLVWKLLASTLFHLPDVTGLPQVQALSARALLVVNTTYVLAIIAAGLAVMTHGSVQIRYGVGELLPRLVIGLAAANFATPICGTIVDTGNALVLALTGQGIASTHALDQLLRVITQQLNNPVAALLTAVIGVILVVLVLMLMIGWITRFIALIVLCGIAPVALACHGTPWSEGAAALWWRSMGAVCLTVILQAVALNTSLSIFLSPGANLTTYGLPYDPSGLLNLVIVAILLGITVRIPALVRRHLTQGNRQNIFGAMVRLIIAQQVTRGLAHTVRITSIPGAGRGAHRLAHARHVTGRTIGDPLRGFTPPSARPRVGGHRDDRARHATSRLSNDPLRDFLPSPESRPTRRPGTGPGPGGTAPRSRLGNAAEPRPGPRHRPPT